jgi:hypothetical protein
VARMGWYDRLSNWVDHLIERQWHLHDIFERHFHAFGLHGPYTRHLAKTRVAPAIAIGLAILFTLAVVLLVRKARARRRRRRLAAAAVPTTRLSAAAGRPPSR